MKRKIVKAIVFIVAVVIALGFVGKARATLIDSNSIVQDDIEYYIQTNKAIYDLGENVEILYRVTNWRDEEWTFTCMPPALDILVTAKEGGDSDTIWFWSWSGIWPTGPAIFHLEPGESLELNGIWSQIDLNDSWEIEDDTQVLPGIYGIGGRIGKSAFNDPISNSLVTLEISIIPEPGSLALLITGSAILHYFNRKRKKVRRT